MLRLGNVSFCTEVGYGGTRAAVAAIERDEEEEHR